MAILDDTRADWNARSPLRPLTRVPWSERVGVSWHWLGDGHGPSAAGSHAKCLERVRDWQAQHQDPNGRIKGKDIGYNALICQHARAIEGRGLTYAGAHSPSVNTSHVGIQFMVGKADPFPSAAMIARAQRLRADVGALGANIRRDWPHNRDPKVSTECCGKALTAWVDAGGPTKQEDDDMPSAEEIADAVWRKQLPKPGNENTQSAGGQLGGAHIYAYRSANALGTLEATVAAQAAALALLAKGQAIDIEQITAAIHEAVAGFELTLAPKKEETP